jgi:hypothetical protein
MLGGREHVVSCSAFARADVVIRVFDGLCGEDELRRLPSCIIHAQSSPLASESL